VRLSSDLQKWRAERPDEWVMDEFIRNAKALEAEIASLKERLRDEFAMHLKIDELTVNMAELIMGSKKPTSELVGLEVIQWWLDAESKYRYMQADSALKAREIR